MPTVAPIGRVRLAVAAAFGAQGLVFISLTTRLPQVKEAWHLGEAALSGLLLMMVLLAGVGSALAEAVARRHDSGTVLRCGMLLIALGAAAVALAPAFAGFVAALAAYGVGLGLVDAAGNMQAVAVERQLGRTILPSFHASWTFGGLLGAAITLAMPSLPPVALLAVVPAAIAAAPFLPRVGDPVAEADLGHDLPWRPVVLIGLTLVLFYMVDTAATTWGPTYLDSTFATPERLVALATFPYLLATLVMRLAGDRLVDRFGPVRVLRGAALVSALALVVVVAAPTWPVAVLGFTLLGLGAAVIAPLSFSAAGRLAGDGEMSEEVRRARAVVVIGRFNQFNYVGALLGAVLTGLVGAESLRIGFAVPMVLVLAVWPLARHFAPSARSVAAAR